MSAIAPRVSVILTTYNRPALAARAVRSVVDQYYTDWELIVVDDGSATPFTLGDAIAVRSNVQLVYQENAGPAVARARGASLASGDLCCFLDDDDYYLPDHLSVLVAAYRQGGEHRSLLRSGMWIEQAGARRQSENYHSDRPALPQYWDRPTSLLSFAIPRQCVRAVPPPTVHSPIEDFEWLVRLLLRYPLRQLPQYTTVYTVHGGNRTHGLVDTESLRQRERVIDRLWALPALAERIGEPARRRILHHQQQHWIRQALRAGRVATALRVWPAALRTSGRDSMREWARTLITLLRELATHETIHLRARKQLAYQGNTLRWRLLRPVYRMLLRARKFRPEDALIIAATPRSGSTWLAEMLNQLPETAVCYEPFHVDRAGVPASLQLGAVPVINEATATPELRAYVTDILTLRRPTYWTGQLLSLRDLRRGRRVMVKCVRGNQALRWMRTTYGFAYPPVVLLRHPLATAVSMLETFRTSPLPIRPLLAAQPAQYARFLPHLDYLETLTTDLEGWVAHWCIDNAEVLRDPSVTAHSLRVYYEDLLLDTRRELHRIFRAWEIAPHRIDRVHTGRTSVTDHRATRLFDPQRQLAKPWELTTEADRQRVQAVLDYFGIDLYHCDDPLPRDRNR